MYILDLIRIIVKYEVRYACFAGDPILSAAAVLYADATPGGVFLRH